MGNSIDKHDAYKAEFSCLLTGSAFNGGAYYRSFTVVLVVVLRVCSFSIKPFIFNAPLNFAKNVFSIGCGGGFVVHSACSNGGTNFLLHSISEYPVY